MCSIWILLYGVSHKRAALTLCVDTNELSALMLCEVYNHDFESTYVYTHIFWTNMAQKAMFIRLILSLHNNVMILNFFYFSTIEI